MAHTKGPWKVQQADPFSPIWILGPDEGRYCNLFIARMGSALGGNNDAPKGEEMPNARLMAAAPELLNALKDLVAFVESLTDVGEYDIEGELEEAKAAIQKAERGE